MFVTITFLLLSSATSPYFHKTSKHQEAAGGGRDERTRCHEVREGKGARDDNRGQSGGEGDSVFPQVWRNLTSVTRSLCVEASAGVS